MKTLLYIILFNISALSLAQDPQLFENDWYLYEVQSSDLGTFYDVSLINPPISPFLNFLENLNFNGEGACNTFNGTYEFIPPNELSTINFTATTNDCGMQQHNSFESEYFGFISGGFSYEINEDSNGRILTLANGIFGYAIFKSYPLSSPEFNKDRFQIYPNPTKDNLHLSSNEETGNLNVKIFTAEGKLITIQNSKFNKETFIDISKLSNGIYFLNIKDENGKTEIKKFLKE